MKTAKENNAIVIFLEGEINAQNVPDFQKEIEDVIAANQGEEILFDANNLAYISSAGLRLLLSIQKKLGKGKITMQNVSRDIYEIFDMTKFTDLMNVVLRQD